ncbi:hypothetical protein HK101_010935, partial [Irineochytrium annulatum]
MVVVDPASSIAHLRAKIASRLLVADVFHLFRISDPTLRLFDERLDPARWLALDLSRDPRGSPAAAADDDDEALIRHLLSTIPSTLLPAGGGGHDSTIGDWFGYDPPTRGADMQQIHFVVVMPQALAISSADLTSHHHLPAAPRPTPAPRISSLKRMAVPTSDVFDSYSADAVMSPPTSVSTTPLTSIPSPPPSDDPILPSIANMAAIKRHSLTSSYESSTLSVPVDRTDAVSLAATMDNTSVYDHLDEEDDVRQYILERRLARVALELEDCDGRDATSMAATHDEMSLRDEIS